MKAKAKKTVKYSGFLLLGLFMAFSILSQLTAATIPVENLSLLNSGNQNLPNMQSSQSTDIEDLIVSKTETISTEFNAIGQLLKSTTKINIELQNNQTDDIKVDFFDRIEGGNNVNPSQGTPTPTATNQHGVLLLNWSNLEINARDTLKLEYLVDQDKDIPINLSMNYILDGVPVSPSPVGSTSTFSIDAPPGSNLTISIGLTNYDEGLFVSTKPVKPVTIALITVSLPLDLLGEPIYTVPPLMSNELSGVNQITFATLIGDDPQTLNITAQVMGGGGWGLIELEPLRVDIIRSPEMFYSLISAINLILGGVTGLEGYWTYLTIESMLDQITMISPLFELLVDILISDFTVFNTILNSLVHIQGYTITELLDNLINGPGLIRNLISLENIRQILNWTPTFPVPPILDPETSINDELNLIENSTVQAIGSQLLALIGNPVDIELYNTSLAGNNTWDSLQFNGNLTAIAISNDLDHDTRPEIIVAYNWTKDSKTYTNISIFEKELASENYVNVWNSSPLDGSVAPNCIGTGDVDRDNERELFVGLINNTGQGNLSIFEFNNSLDLNDFEYHDILFENGGISSLLIENNLNLDNDTNGEFVVGLNNGSAYIINGTWDGTSIYWTVKWSEDLVGQCNLLARGDTDQDSRQEIMCSNNTQISIFENTSLGFRPLKNLTNYNLDIITGDSDSDNRPEIITCNKTWINVFEPIISVTIIEDPLDPAKTTIIKTLEGYKNTASMNLTSAISNSTGITNLVLGDFDHDQNEEIVAATENGSIFFYEKIADNNYMKILEYTLNTTNYGIRRINAGDVDGDGYLDLVILGQDNKFHVLLKPFDIYDLNVRIFANLTLLNDTSTNLYVKIDLKNMLINYPIPHMENLSYIYNGSGPSIWHFLINTVEIRNSTDLYHTNVTQEISPEGVDPLSGVIGVWNRSEFNFTSMQPYPTAINYYDPGLPSLKGSFEGNNITFKAALPQHPMELVVNYSYYLFSNPLFGLNLTIIPPYNYSFPGINSTMPSIYPFLAHLLDIRTSPLIMILGNLTTSLSKQYLILNSTISPDIGPYKPITLEGIFNLLGLFNIFDELLNLTQAPFDAGGGFEIPLPENLPINLDLLAQAGTDLQFISRLNMFMEPRIHSRFVTNITLFGNFGFLEQAMELLSLQSLLGLESYQFFENYTQYSDFPKGLDLKPILIKDLNGDGENDTIVAVNGFYPTYEIRALNSSNQALLWKYPVVGPIINMTFDGDSIIRATILNIENSWLVKNETQNSTVYTSNIIENGTSSDNRTVIVRYNINTYDSPAIYGVWNRSEFNFITNQPTPSAINYYNETEGAYFDGRTIHLSTELNSTNTPVVINYTKKTPTLVTLNYPVKSVVGAWNVSTMTGENYFTGGSINGYNITLGTDLPTANSTVWIKYQKYSNASAFTYLFDYSGQLLDDREILLNKSQFFNGTTYISHTYYGPDLGVIQTPYIINCSSAVNPNYYLMLIVTENSIFAINGSLKTTPELMLVFNNTGGRNQAWQIQTGTQSQLLGIPLGSIGLNFIVTDIGNDGRNELLYVDTNGILHSHNLINGSELWHNPQRLDTVTSFKAEDLDNDGIKEIIVGSANQKVYVFNGSTGTFLWSYMAGGGINDLAIADIQGDSKKEILVGSSDKNLYVLNGTSGLQLWNFTISGSIKSVAIGDMTNDGILEIILGSNQNMIHYLNATDASNVSILWNHTVSGQIAIFQFSRTNDAITLHYDLPDRIFEGAYEGLEGILGQFTGFGSDMGTGIDSILDLGLGGMEVNLEDLSDVNLPEGIGLLNFMTYQIQLILSLNEIGQVTRAQREFTGRPEVRECGEMPNVNIFQKDMTAFIGGSNHNLTRFEIYNNDSLDQLRLNYFTVILSDDNGSIPINRCRFYMWNGANFIDIMNNQYYNMTLDMLDITYINETGEMRFRPFIDINPYEQKNATVDWKGRPIYIEVIDYNGTLNLTYWADVSMLLPGVTYNDVTTSISYSYTYPVFIVEALMIPTLPLSPTEAKWWEDLLADPLFYALFLVFGAVAIELMYLRKRERYQIHRLSYKHMINWLRVREKNWKSLVKQGTMNRKQYRQLHRLRGRLAGEVKPRWYTDLCIDKIKENAILDTSFSTMLLLPFWRKLGKKNRLVKVLDDMFNAIFGPTISSIKQAGSYMKKKLKKKPRSQNATRNEKNKSIFREGDRNR